MLPDRGYRYRASIENGHPALHPDRRNKPLLPQPPVPSRIQSRGPQLGHLVFEGQAGTVPCTVASLTPEGAVVATPGWLGMPDRFGLQLRQAGLQYDCRVVSRRGGSAKVAFLGSAG